MRWPDFPCSARECCGQSWPRRRARWKQHQGSIDPARPVILDETVKTNMAPLRVWVPWGERLAGRHPHVHSRTLTFLAALRCDRLKATGLFDGPINGESFTAWGSCARCSRRSSSATWSPWTISAATRERPSAPPFDSDHPSFRVTTSLTPSDLMCCVALTS